MTIWKEWAGSAGHTAEHGEINSIFVGFTVCMMLVNYNMFLRWHGFM